MARLQALNPAQHKNLCINVDEARKATATVNMLPVVLSEFRQLIVDYPIMLTKNAETGAFSLIALLGLERGENLFWRSGAWDATYLPLGLRRLPFVIGNNDNKQSDKDHDFLICLDPENAAITPETGEALFSEDGRPTRFLQDMQTVLARLIEGEPQTENFVSKLLAHKLVTPMTLDIELVDGETLNIEGLYGIDEVRLQRLESETLTVLNQQGHLEAIYNMAASTGHIRKLIQLKNALLATPDPWLQPDS